MAKQRKQNETNKGNITETASEDLSSEIKDVSEDNSVDVITDNAEDISLENETDRIQDTAEIITDKDGTDKWDSESTCSNQVCDTSTVSE